MADPLQNPNDPTGPSPDPAAPETVPPSGAPAVPPSGAPLGGSPAPQSPTPAGTDPQPPSHDEAVEEGAERPVQPHEADPPTQPQASTSQPKDALEGAERTDPNDAGVPVTEGEGGPVGPEDALDPNADTRGEYEGRVDDAAHFVHQPVDDPPGLETGEPLTEPVAQNAAAEESIADGSLQHSRVANDQAGEEAQQAATEQAGQQDEPPAA